jgi:hypothetical protein
MASEVRAALTRGSAVQRVARSAASTTPPRRKRPGRGEAPENASADGELDGLFAGPDSERRVSADGELEGMFPREEALTVGANGAPLPD